MATQRNLQIWIIVLLSLYSYALAAVETEDRVLRIHNVDTAAFPEITITTSIRPPYPQFTISNDPLSASSSFKINEVFRGTTTRINPISVEPGAGRADAVNLVLVLDYTQSIASDDFEKLKDDGKYLVSSLRDSDLAAIYAFNHTPELKSEFISDREQLKGVIDSLQREGKSTRVFDALYSGIYSARAGIRLSGSGVVQSAVVIFTDGRDEGSSIKEEDLHEILRIGTDYRIPVFTVLYGKSENTNMFSRMTIKTGGLVINRSDDDSVDSLVDMIRRIPARTYKIKFRSSIGSGDFPHPWSQSIVRIELKGLEGPGEDEVTYRLPFMSILMNDIGSGRGYYVSAIAILFVVIGFFILLRLFRRKPGDRNKKKTRADERAGRGIPESSSGRGVNALSPSDEVTPKTGNAVEREHRRWEEMGEELDQGIVEEKTDAIPMKTESTGEVKKIKSPYKVLEESDLLEEADGTEDQSSPVHDPFEEFDENSLYSASEVEMSTGIALTAEGERRVYMREYVYHLLQLALRGADRYEDASLRLETAKDRFDEKIYDLFLPTTTIGSGKWANIRLRESSVSPVHARIKKVDGKFVIYDMLSRTGTYVNDKKLLRPKALRDGDEIQFGRKKFRFSGKR